jgi:hypothetical protein
VVRAGDTLQSIAAMYFGSASYWYLVADANGLTGSEPLVEGTTLTLPNRIANGANTADTFKVYNETEIIGSTSPEIRTIQKKKKWYQTLIQIVIIVILIVAAVVVAIYAPYLMKEYGFVMGSLYAAAFGAGVMTVASITTQGLAMAAGLQDEFDWKAVGKAAVSGAVSAMIAGIGGTYASGSNWMYNTAVRVGMEVGRQYVTDGRITNVAGLAGAAIQAGALAKLGEGGGALGDAAAWMTEHSRTVTAGLSILENAVRGRGDNAMQWVALATAAVFDSKVVSPTLTTDAGSLNWKYVAVEAVGATVVGNEMGEEAGLAYLGQAIGQGIGERLYREDAISRQRATLGDKIGKGFAGLNTDEQRALSIMSLDRDPAFRNALEAALAPPGAGGATQMAALTPAQRAAMAAGYGPLSPDAAEQVAPGGVLRRATQAQEGVAGGAGAQEPTAAQERSGRYAVTVGKGDTVIGIAKREFGDDWRAGVAVIAGLNELKTDRYGNPIIREGQELGLLSLAGAAPDALKQLGSVGGEIVAGNSRRNAEVRAYEAKLAEAAAAEPATVAALAEGSRAQGGAVPSARAEAGGAVRTGSDPFSIGYSQVMAFDGPARGNTSGEMPHFEATGSIRPDPGFIAAVEGVFGSDLPLGDKLGMAWNNAKYYFRNSERAQGTVQAAGGALEVLGAVPLSSTGAGAVVGVPLAFHGGDNIGTGLSRVIRGEPQETVTYTLAESVTGSPTVARTVDSAMPFLGIVAGGAQALNSSARLANAGTATARTLAAGEGSFVANTTADLAAADAAALRRTYLNEKFGRTGSLDADITLRGYMSEVERLNVSSGYGEAVMYSGPGNRLRAEAFSRNGGITLESTPGGAWLDNQALFKRLPPEQAILPWERLSQRYAQNASGPVNVFIDGANPRGVFTRIELPAVYSNPNVPMIIKNGVQPIRIK